MTKLRYSQDCAAGLQVRRRVPDPAYRWGVNFNNGNTNINNSNNRARVRACRPSESSGVSLSALHAAWLAARYRKKPSHNQSKFEAFWMDRLLMLREQLNTGQWQPSPTACFVATLPKAREIHAPDFADRVVHHAVVPHLVAMYEPRFIFDSYANRDGKGTHAAVERLRGFVRQVHSGQSGGWYLQLDIRNFFNSIHRPTLWRMIKPVMVRNSAPEWLLRAVHALLTQNAAADCIDLTTADQRARIPAHKRLANASAGCGIAIGNLSSQFFANVYLDALDQFCKHELRCKRYLRYVDDFVLVHHCRKTLTGWLNRIREFVGARLRLQLKSGTKLAPLGAGIDFLGYVVYPTHTVVRMRVIRHAFSKLRAFEREHVRPASITATRQQLHAIRSTWASYLGHFKHAQSMRLQQQLRDRFTWLRSVLIRRAAERNSSPIVIRRYMECTP